MHSFIRPVLFRASVLFSVLPFISGCAAIAGKPPEGKEASKSDAKAKAKTASAPAATAPWNEAVLAALDKIPIGGGYSTGVDARDALLAGISWEEDKPALRPKAAQPSFCSGATYLAFLVMLAQQQRAGRLILTPDAWRALIVEGQADGHGVWGRWNANGPGTARLFHELGIGTNFTDIKQAKPGDFMKIFWNEGIGASERGHSVIFMGTGSTNGQEMVSFWSSNQPGGYGTKEVPRSKIQRVVFSRLESPEKLAEVAKLPEKDAFLASLEEKSVSPAAAAEAVGLKKW
ncbi:MAG: hypothetical protein DVB28_000650 [Verrucomicrobia bacterium]|nr:MAG: hypothetical protein DVB28_000650 [Verrucomicrobiota bacterium]